MVLGPDLLGWKLTEARVWAMLRDEEALQARRCVDFCCLVLCGGVSVVVGCGIGVGGAVVVVSVLLSLYTCLDASIEQSVSGLVHVKPVRPRVRN